MTNDERRSVCFVLQSAYGYFNTDVDVVGGGARQLSFISRELTDEFDVHFVVGDYGQPRREVYDGVTVHRSYRPSPDTRTREKPVQLLKLFTAMRRANADVYVYRGRPFQAALLYSLTKLLRRKWVYNLANDPNVDEQPAALPRPLQWLFARSLSDADAVIAQTDAQATKLQSKYGVSATVVPSGYPPAESTIPHAEREYVLWVGRLDPVQKRPHLLLDVAERCPDCEFVIVGPAGQNPTYNDRIRSRVDDLENVAYVGSVPPDEIHGYYERAIALVNTSDHEGFPSTFLEAWRVDTPVVSLDVPPSRYVEIPSDAGYANGDVDELVATVKELIVAPERRGELSRPAHEYFRENLTIEHVAERYAAVLRAVCAGQA